MARQTLAVRAATVADVSAISDIYFDAFADSVIMQRCFPPTSKKSRQFFLEDVLKQMKDARARWLVVTEREGAPVMAFAKWVAPRQKGIEEKKKKKNSDEEEPVCPSDGDEKLAREFFGGMHDAHQNIMGSRPHWFLSLIGTKRECQGRGAAGQLIRFGLDCADREGVECFLDATPAGKPVYERYGFETVRELKFLDGAIDQFCMIRPPNHVWSRS